MLMKICPCCGKSIRQDEKHTCRHKEYNKSRRKADTKFYSSQAWNYLRQYVKARACGIDEYVFYKTGKVIPGNAAHHIVPVRDADSLKLDADNLIYLSHATHEMVHATYSHSKADKVKMIDELRQARRFVSERI